MTSAKKHHTPILCILACCALVGNPVLAQQKRAASALQGFFEALNAESLDQMRVFYESGVTEEFLSKKSWEGDRAMYQRLRDDLGHLSVRGLRRTRFPIRDGTSQELAIGYTTGEMAGQEPGPLRPNIGMLPIRGCPAGSSSRAG